MPAITDHRRTPYVQGPSVVERCYGKQKESGSRVIDIRLLYCYTVSSSPRVLSESGPKIFTRGGVSLVDVVVETPGNYHVYRGGPDDFLRRTPSPNLSGNVLEGFVETVNEFKL